MGGSDEERALRKKNKKKNKEDGRFAAVKSAIIKRLGDTCDVSVVEHGGKGGEGGRGHYHYTVIT